MRLAEVLRITFAPLALLKGGAVLARAARTCLEKLAQDPQEDTEFLTAKIATARFYAENILTQVPGLFIAMEGGWQTLRNIPDDAL